MTWQEMQSNWGIDSQLVGKMKQLGAIERELQGMGDLPVERGGSGTSVAFRPAPPERSR